MPIEVIVIRDNDREAIRKINNNFAQGGGGGGVTAMSLLSDTATIDLPTVNVPLGTALSSKQPKIAIGTGKLLAGPATLGGEPTQITLGTNLSLSGSTLNAAGGGGGGVVAPVEVVASTNLGASHVNRDLIVNSATATTQTIAATGFAAGDTISGYNRGAGAITFAAANGTAISGSAALPPTVGQYEAFLFKRYSDAVWIRLA